jgi:putative transposase
MATKQVIFQLYPNKTQGAKLHYWRKLHCLVYNAAVANRKTQYQRFGRNVDYFEQQNCLPEFKKVWTEYVELGSQALQATLKRVDFAFQRFFKLKSGYPKFKKSRYYRGWTYPGKAGWKIESDGHNGKLTLSNLGRIQIRGKARDWGTPKTCTIIFKQSKWFASITIDCEPTRPTTDIGAIGLDFGVNHGIATSEGELIDNPKFLKQAQKKIRQIAKKARGKRIGRKGVKPSRRYRKAQKALGKIQSKVGRQRQDWQHQISSKIVSDNSLIATEKLNLKAMTKKSKGKRKRQKTGLNRSILDVGIGNLKSLIKYKVTEAGGFYLECPTKKVKPSQTCPKCGHQEKKTLGEREHNCKKCGYTTNRDVAAAQVMLNWARGQEMSSTDVESPSSTPCGSMAQLGALKRQKPRHDSAR